jgi:hypothetical protein
MNKIIPYFFITATSAILHVTTFGQAMNSSRELLVQKIAGEIAIDGELDESLWKEAVAISKISMNLFFYFTFSNLSSVIKCLYRLTGIRFVPTKSRLYILQT